MTRFYIRIFCLLFTTSFALFSSAQAQSVKDLLIGGTWLGYISVDGKPVYKLTILSTQNEDKSYIAGIYFLRFTKNGEGVEYDTVKMYLNEHDTTADFDLALPKESKMQCKGKVIIKRPDLYSSRIKATYQPDKTCGKIALFLNEPQAMLTDKVYSNPPDVGLPVAVVSNTPKIPADLLGADTPDHLGRTMLKALQTNNKKLWAGCIHPTYDFQRDPNRRERVINEFDKIRSDLELKGLSDWSQVTFSRIIAQPCEQCAAPGEKWLSELVVEFWYQGKEFLGKISFTPVMTYKGKYYIGRNYDHAMIRYKGGE